MADERPGLYGRTNKGKIIRFAWLQDENGQTMERCVVKFVNGGLIKYWLDKDESIVKHSKNITDLIEIGDILKIEISKEWADDDRIKIIAVGPTFTKKGIIRDIENGLYHIKSIVTKEQYKEIEYIVEE